jgi:hypothetical protein
MRVYKVNIIIVLFLPLILFSQNKEYNNILFCKSIKQKSIILSDEQKKINFPDIFFNKEDIKSTTSFYVESENDIVAINRRNGSVLECKFYSEESIIRIKDKIDLYSKNNYSSLTDDFDYKKYSVFVERGLIVVVDDVEMKVLLIRVDSCMFPNQKKYVLKELKKQKRKNVYVFNCGGKELISLAGLSVR